MKWANRALSWLAESRDERHYHVGEWLNRFKGVS